MLPPKHFSKLLLGIFSLLVVTPELAHSVKVSGDTEITFHIHDARAQKPVSVSFALKSRNDKKLIPFSGCNCQLAIYAIPRTQGDKPLAQPALKAVNTDEYQGIPGTEITFPKAGKYNLTLSGTPKKPFIFTPFKVTETITVDR